MPKTKPVATLRQLRAGPAKPGAQLLFKRQVMELIGVTSYTTIYEWMKVDLFPRPVELGPPGGRSSLIAWYAYEVQNWLATRPRRQFGQHEFRGPERIDDSKAKRRAPTRKPNDAPGRPPVPQPKRATRALTKQRG